MKSKLKLFLLLYFIFAFGNVLAMEENSGEVATQALGAAIVQGDVEGVKKAIAQGADVDATYVNGRPGHIQITRPCIGHAIWLRDHDIGASIVALLLEHKADPNIRDLVNDCPLHSAVDLKRYKCQELLLQYGADPTLRNEKAELPIHIAAKRLSIHFVNALVNYIPGQDVQDLITAKRNAAVVVLLCFKRFEKGEGAGVKMPKDIQRMLCDYCTPGIVAINALADKKIKILNSLFSKTYKNKSIWQIANGSSAGRMSGWLKSFKRLTNLENLDQHRPAIRENIIKALQEIPLRPFKKAKCEK